MPWEVILIHMSWQRTQPKLIPINLLGVVGSDFADPPYGIRESPQHISRRQGRKGTDDASPAPEKYDLTSIYVDLLNFLNVHLHVSGRLVFWMPAHITTYDERQTIQQLSRSLLHIEYEDIGTNWWQLMVGGKLCERTIIQSSAGQQHL